MPPKNPGGDPASTNVFAISTIDIATKSAPTEKLIAKKTVLALDRGRGDGTSAPEVCGEAYGFDESDWSIDWRWNVSILLTANRPSHPLVYGLGRAEAKQAAGDEVGGD